jgi:DNA polymerase-3 subunit delta
MKQLQMLDLMRSEMDDKRLQAAQVMMTLGRHIHFKRKPIIEKALRDWTSQAFAEEAGKLQATVLESRRRQSLEPSVALQALLATAARARRRT